MARSINDVLFIEETPEGIILLRMEDRESKNTFSEKLMKALVQAFDEIKASDKYKAAILTGYDTYFSCGGTQEGMLKIQDGSVNFTDLPLYQLPLQCPIPVISAMQGHGVGGGFVLGLFADFIILSRESRYTTNFMQYGFTPGMGATYIVPEKLGAVLGHEMLFTAKRYRGVDLEKRGLSIPILPRTDVLTHAIDLAKNLCAKPRLSLVTLKDHLVRKHREIIPEIIEREVKMHDITFHQPEVAEKIKEVYGEIA